jgi:hypothetical protein
MSLTSFARTVDALLRSEHDTNLHEFISTRRSRGLSFDEIARNLAITTGGTVQVTRTTVVNWWGDLVEKVSS